MKSWLIIEFVFLFLFLSQAQIEEIEVENRFGEEGEYEEPEEVILKKEDLAEWLGEDQLSERDERHAVGMCWQSEMTRCLRNCENVTAEVEILQEICASYCQADVTWMCSQLNLAYGGTEIFKFSGRWPFRRVLWFTEFGSCLFCALSVIAHAYFFYEYRAKTNNKRNERKKDGQTYPFDWLWQSMHPIWGFTFACAFTFHTVDIRLTEYADYFTAMIASLFGLYVAIVRVFEIRKVSNLWVLATPFIGFYFFHVMRMGMIHFAYGYNMKATMSIVVAQSVLWLGWCALNYSKARYALWMVAGHVLLFAFALLEVFDRPPLFGMFDPHSLWHLAITIIFFFWNRFYIADSLNYSRPDGKFD